MERRFYWLKFKEDFFGSKRMKKLRKMAGGDTYIIIYLKMQLKALRSEGVLTYTGLEENFADELALDIDENPEDVRMVLAYLMSYELCECSDNIHYFLPYVVENTGSETDNAQRVRAFREKQKALEPPKQQAKTNAERQSSFRAKQLCEKNGHVPYIEDHANKKRYNGNYYLCFRRDKCRCAICGSVENLCMHHIDGYDENKPENSNANKMLTLCRECHSNVHAGSPIPEDILESIGYFDECNEICNAPVMELKSNCNAEIEKEKEKEIEIEHTEKKQASPRVFKAPTLDEVKAYAKEAKLDVDCDRFFQYFTTPNDAGQTWIDSKGNKVKNWKQKLQTWARKDTSSSNGSRTPTKWEESYNKWHPESERSGSHVNLDEIKLDLSEL